MLALLGTKKNICWKTTFFAGNSRGIWRPKAKILLKAKEAAVWPHEIIFHKFVAFCLNSQTSSKLFKCSSKSYLKKTVLENI